MSIAYENNESEKKFIQGIYVEPSGFLSDKNKKDAFVLKFSDALNCFIGGQVGILELLKMSIDKESYEKRYNYSLLEFTYEYSLKMVEDSIIRLTEKNEKKLIDAIFEQLVTDNNIGDILDYLKLMVRQVEKLSLYFNVNCNESNNRKTVYKDVLHLSLGQKVVAMLDFVLGYGEYVNDYRPILIDQPEDNLDSQYIYINLVFQLRKVKQKRQIIIATHNATIVTNAMADQVCVMQSDGNNGWVEMVGYPSELRIKTSILNYLEGGVESFKHKAQIYRPAID